MTVMTREQVAILTREQVASLIARMETLLIKVHDEQFDADEPTHALSEIHDFLVERGIEED